MRTAPRSELIRLENRFVEGAGKPTGVTTYISLAGLVKYYASLPQGAEAKHFARKLRNAFTSDKALIGAGFSMSAKFVHKSLRTRRTFDEWCAAVMVAAPRIKRDAAFRITESSDDFLVSYAEVVNIAMAEASLAGMVVAYAVLESGFYCRTQLQLCATALVAKHFNNLLSHPHGFVDARQLSRFLEVEDYHYWLGEILESDLAKTNCIALPMSRSQSPEESNWLLTPKLVTELIKTMDYLDYGDVVFYAFIYFDQGWIACPEVLSLRYFESSDDELQLP